MRNKNFIQKHRKSQLTRDGEGGGLTSARLAGERVSGQAGVHGPSVLLPRRLDVQIALRRHHEASTCKANAQFPIHSVYIYTSDASLYNICLCFLAIVVVVVVCVVNARLVDKFGVLCREFD